MDLNAEEARNFLLLNKSYCNFDLPHYFDFQPIINVARSILEQKKSIENCKKQKINYSNYDEVNYCIVANKDSNYAWREMQLIHPLLYVDLVYEITKEEHWNTLKNCFTDHLHSDYISVAGLPTIAMGADKEVIEEGQ